MKQRDLFSVRLAVVLLLASGAAWFLPTALGAPADDVKDAAQQGTAEAAVASDGAIAFSARAEALPFPPDAREVEFDATFKDVEFRSGSSLASLAAFYRTEMVKRGWQVDVSAASSEEDAAEMTFGHEGAEVVVELDVRSDGVVVSFDCEGLDFSQAGDPAALVGAGVPQPRAYLFLQKEIPRPQEIHDVEYRSDECHFKSPLALQAAFDFYGKALKGLGWRESRRPIVAADRRYTEFQRGPVEVSVNIFAHEAGSRIILGYENETKELLVPPLAEVASVSLAGAAPGVAPESLGAGSAESPAAAPVDVSRNTGSATVKLGGKTYMLKHAAAFRTKRDGDDKTRLVFSERAIPWQRMQTMLAKEEDFSFGDLYEFDTPGYLTLQVDEYWGFSFSAGGVGIGDGMDDPDGEIKVEEGRVRGAVTMREPKEFFDESFHIALSIDAAVMTPRTRLGTVPDMSAVVARQGAFAGAELLLPEGAGNVRGEGSRYSKSTHAEVDLELKAVVSFYRKELTAQGWTEVEAPGGQSGGAEGTSRTTLRFKNASGSMTVALAGAQQRTIVDIAFQDDAKAKLDGILPEPGKGRIVLVNGSAKNVVIMIGKQSYPLKAGQGSLDPKTALNYSVAPGTYELTFKVPGEAEKAESLAVAAGETWGVITLPTGASLTNRMYWSGGAAGAPKNPPAAK